VKTKPQDLFSTTVVGPAETSDGGLLQPEIILPVQQLRSGSSADVPEKRLMLAILNDAVRSFQRYRFAHRNRDRRLFKDADDWLCSTDTDWPFSFERICQVLELDASCLRSGLSQWDAGRLAHVIKHNAATRAAPQRRNRRGASRSQRSDVRITTVGCATGRPNGRSCG